MSGRRSTRRGIVLGVAAVLVTTGVVVAVLTVVGGLPDRVHELDKACGGTTYDDAAPYAGPAPHPVAVFMPSEVGQLLKVTPYLPDDSVWEPGHPEDTAVVQLVACGTLEGEQRSGKPVCGYHGRSVEVPMSLATYRITVYELRTHREVRSAVVEGAGTGCPPAISAHSTPDRFLSELTGSQWQSVLADLTEAPPTR